MPRCPPPVIAAAPRRVVAVGDLNGALDALVEVLEGTGLIDHARRWTGGCTHLVQLGDLFNRGEGGREAFELLRDLGPEARRKGGEVTVLLGNHEVMTALGNEVDCSVGEYLSFATPAQRKAWPERVSRATRRLYDEHPPGGPIRPLAPRVELWKLENVPGKAALRRALGPRGHIGRAIRALPVALRADSAVFMHAGVSPAWARHGVDGLNRLAAFAWRDAPRFYGLLDRASVLREGEGPLWNRRLALGRGAETEAELESVLAHLGTRRLVVGHTQTLRVPGGRYGRIASRFDARLICLDVSMTGASRAPRAALVIEGRQGSEWTPSGARVLWRDRK